MSFFSDLGGVITGAGNAAVNLIDGYGDVVQSQAAYNQAQAAVASSNAATQLELAKQEADKKKEANLMLILGASVAALLVIAIVIIRIF